MRAGAALAPQEKTEEEKLMIRRAEDRDLESIVKLLLQVHKVHSDARPDIFRPGSRKYRDEEILHIIHDEKTPVWVLTEEDDTPVLGYCFCEVQETKDDASLQDRRVLYIDDLCVDENARRGHVGKRLYDFVTKWASENGFDAVTLNVWSSNPGAMKFYETMGLKPLKVTMENRFK